MPIYHPGYVLYSASERPPDDLWFVSTSNYSGALFSAHVEYNTFVGSWSGWTPDSGESKPLAPGAPLLYPFTLFPGMTHVAFRRATPSSQVINSPLSADTRITAHNLRVWANQGLFAAQEWAGLYGVNIQAPFTLVTPLAALPPITTRCTHTIDHQTLNQREWEFSFLNGYLQREHVKLVCLVGADWLEYPISPPGIPGVFCRFVNHGSLYIDVPQVALALGGEISKLCIYRNTLRGGEVTVPVTGSGITALGMSPSASVASLAIQEIADMVYPLINPVVPPPNLLPVAP